MKRATIYIDSGYEVSDDGYLFGRYNIGIDFPDETYEELYQV
jgi:hypothetical protein